MEKLVAVDIGYGFVKVADDRKGFSFPSVVGVSNHTDLPSMRLKKVPIVDRLTIEIEDQLYNVGKSAMKHSQIMSRDLTIQRTTKNYIDVLLFSALSLYAKDEYTSFKLVTGLPPGRMHMEKELRRKYKDKSQSIVLVEEGKKTPYMIRIEDIEVVPQPIGTFWSTILDYDGQISNDIDGRIGVIDVGFGTSDLALIEGGEFVYERSHTLNEGLSNSFREIQKQIKLEFGVEVDNHLLEETIRKNEVKLMGKPVDISEICNKVFTSFCNNLMVEISSLWNLNSLDKVLITGGGGKLYSPYLLSDIPHASLIEDSFTANVRGYLSWLKRDEYMV